MATNGRIKRQRQRDLRNATRRRDAATPATPDSDEHPATSSGPRLNEVFVAGTMPSVTYVARTELRLEEQLREYLDDRGTILSVSGPTKTGKTTLLRNVAPAPRAVWLSGGSLSSVSDLWNQVADHLEIPHETTSGWTSEIGTEKSLEGGLSGKGISATRSTSKTDTQTASGQSTFQRGRINAAREAVRNKRPVIVIDDFHYLNQPVQLEIVRSLKDLVFDGLGAIFASVPHRAYDAVRVEKEMTGRVTHLGINTWSDPELVQIAIHGFEALGVLDRGGLAGRLAAESFGSPHLMQSFCKRLCRENGVNEYMPDGRVLQSPDDWNSFFQSTAQDTSKSTFDLLASGPRQRTDRIQRDLKDGRRLDIYGAILAAIAHTGPKLSIEYETLRSALRDILASELPQRHEITRVLDQMTAIAKEKIEGEPVVDYDEQLSTLHISDPFFAFYLRWGRPRADTAS